MLVPKSQPQDISQILLNRFVDLVARSPKPCSKTWTRLALNSIQKRHSQASRRITPITHSEWSCLLPDASTQTGERLVSFLHYSMKLGKSVKHASHLYGNTKSESRRSFKTISPSYWFMWNIMWVKEVICTCIHLDIESYSQFRAR